VATAVDRSVDASPWARVRVPALVAGAVLGASLLLHLRDPHRSGSWGYCPWLLLTGTYCPGCGGLRAVNDLTDGRFAAAASSNLLFVGSLPLVLFLWGRWTLDRWRGINRHVTTRRAFLLSGAFLAVTVMFWVLRNLPAAAWLAP
jgi:Protein of unknown function (DUF2752)